MIPNENMLHNPNPTRWKADVNQLQGVIEEAARIVREKAPGRKVTVRFCGVANPWAKNPDRSFDPQRMLKALDIIGQNIYIDPDDDHATEPEKLMKGTPPSLSWDILAEAAERCRNARKEFWITEFGCPWRDNDGKQNLERHRKKGWDVAYAKWKSIGVKNIDLQIAQDQPHGFYNKGPWRAVTLIAADRFLVKQGLLTGEPTLKAPTTGEKIIPAP